MAGKRFPLRVATVSCNGGCRAVKTNDVMLCKQGCIGCGACVSACKFDAIHLNEYGVAAVDEEKCIGCGMCAKKCPQNLIRIREKGIRFIVQCSNVQKGKEAKDACAASCIGCGICVKKCPADAIQIIDNHAVIDENLCLSCGFCAANCPRKVIKDSLGIL